MDILSSTQSKVSLSEISEISMPLAWKPMAAILQAVLATQSNCLEVSGPFMLCYRQLQNFIPTDFLSRIIGTLRF